MSITKSYNKLTNTYYAYETTYEWNDVRQKKVQRKHCIGQFGPDTGEILPNGKIGRPGRIAKTKTEKSQAVPARKLEQEPDIETLLMFSKEIHGIKGV